MKKMLIALVAFVCCSVASVKAAEVEPLFRAGEVGLTLSGGGLLNPSDVETVTPGVSYDCYQSEESLDDSNNSTVTRKNGHKTVNFTVGAFWFPLKRLGFELNVPVYQNDGVSVEEIQAGLLVRCPLSDTTPVLRRVAPYVGLGGAYNWRDDERWSYIGKGGVEVRLNKNVAVFTEFQYRNNDAHLDNGSKTVQGGLKVVF